MIADAQTAKWQAKYGRDPTDEQLEVLNGRGCQVNKVRADIAMKATKLNAQLKRLEHGMPLGEGACSMGGFAR
jgi:hypothetical protein